MCFKEKIKKEINESAEVCEIITSLKEFLLSGNIPTKNIKDWEFKSSAHGSTELTIVIEIDAEAMDIKLLPKKEDYSSAKV